MGRPTPYSPPLPPREQRRRDAHDREVRARLRELPGWAALLLDRWQAAGLIGDHDLALGDDRLAQLVLRNRWAMEELDALRGLGVIDAEETVRWTWTERERIAGLAREYDIDAVRVAVEELRAGEGSQ